MPDFKRLPGKFIYTGMDIHHPVDLIPEGRSILQFNLQPDTQTGALQVRPPIESVATTPAGAPMHSVCRMNDSVPGASQPYTRFAGAAGNLYYGAGSALSLLDSGYSGNPLAIVPYRPSQAPDPWAYIYDSARQRRAKTDGTLQQIGIAAPRSEPSLLRAQPLYDIVDNAANAAIWSGGTPSGGVVSAVSQVNRVTPGTSVASILYDSGTTGMAVIVPTNVSASYAWMLAGSMISFGGETVVIEQAFRGTLSTTVAAIQYDTGSTGLATIVPAIPLPGLFRNMGVYLNGTTFVRVLSVTAGPDGSYSFRCSTGAATITAGQTIAAQPSFRAWTTINHLFGETISGYSLTCSFTPTVVGGSMSDIVATNFGLPVTTNLTFAGSRPLQNEDYMHLSLAFDHPEYVTEVHVLLDVDAQTNDFNHNYYYYVLRQGDFQQSLTGSGGQTTVAGQLQAITDSIANQIAAETYSGAANVAQPPYPIPQVPSTAAPSPGQFGTAQLQWLEAIFKLNDLTRIGSDVSRTLANAVKVGIYVFTSGGIVNFYWGGWWVGGGYGPDCNFNSYGNQAPEIQWRYRYRNSLTGAHSTVSPETPNGEILRRQAVNLTASNSPDPQVDIVDWERRGGTNPDWHYIGSVPAGTTFIDNVTEAAAQAGDPLEVACYQPWPVTDTPQTGTATVVGTSVVWASGSQFNTRWLRGTEIIIGGNTYSLFEPPVSSTVLRLAQNVPPAPGVYAFSIPEATIEGQPIYGAWLDEANNRVCAVGDDLNPGLMYFANRDNPDGASDSGYIEITSPSEPLLNGFYAEGANYAFTSSSLYRVESTPGAINPYQSYRLSGVEGLAGAWAFDYQRRILFYWGPDGIYAYAFGPAGDNLTATDLYPLFPNAGQQSISGVPISIHGYTVYPPNYAASSQLRVGYSESFVYATYQNSNGQTEALVYSLTAKGWRIDSYSPAVTLFLLEKGIPNPALLACGVDGNLYKISSTATADAGGAISWLVLSPCRDAGDSRANKQWGDLMLDYSTGTNSSPPGLLVVWDDLLIDGANPAVPLSANRTQQIYDLVVPPDTNDLPLIHRNIAVAIAGTGPIYLYEWQPSYLPLPENTTGRVTDWQTGGAARFKYVQGIRIHANTFGVAKQVQVQYDGYQIGPTITIDFNGEQIEPFSFSAPFKAHMMRLVPLDNVPWQIWPDCEWIAQPEPDPANYWISQPTALGQSGYVHCREIWPAWAGPRQGVISVIVDGGTAVTLANLAASSSPVKGYFPCPPLKGRYWQLTASGTGLQLYENDIEFLVKSWGSTGPYARVRPFGDSSGGGGQSGARI